MRESVVAGMRKLGKWELGQQIGGGGNADVYQSQDPVTGDSVAIKVLRGRRREPKARFRREVMLQVSLAGVSGVLPVLDSHLPEDEDADSHSWLVMPLAEPVANRIDKTQLEEIVAYLRDIASILCDLHERGISHRDIKCDNLFVFDDRAAVSDFGIADGPDVETITEVGKPVGSRYYIAPEMISDPGSAEGTAVDVYSLGKTLWVLASGQHHPLPGQHRIEEPSMGVSAYTDHPRARNLELLLERMTATSPAQRPTMKEVRTELASWLTPVGLSEPRDLSEISRRFLDITAPSRRAEEIEAQSVVLQRELLEECERLLTPLFDRAVHEGLPAQWTTADPVLRRVSDTRIGVALGARGAKTFQVGHALARPAYLGKPSSFYVWSSLGFLELEDGRVCVFGGFVHGPLPNTAVPLGDFVWQSSPVLLGSSTQDAELNDSARRMTEAFEPALSLLVDALSKYGIE